MAFRPGLAGPAAGVPIDQLSLSAYLHCITNVGD
jgi:hypothetical protein